MFAAKVEAGTLAEAIEPVTALVDECKIHLNEAGIEITAVDPANVGMVDLHLDAAAFNSYEASGGTIGINLSRLEDIISLSDSGEVLTIELNEETRRLDIEAAGLSYTLALIDSDSIRKEPDIPDLELGTVVSVAGREIDRTVEAADMVASHVTFATDGEEEVFYAEAEGDTDDVYVEIAANGDHADSEAEAVGAAESLFSLDYLDNMNKAIPKDATVQMEVGKEMPIDIGFELADGHCHATYVLAPRIND